MAELEAEDSKARLFYSCAICTTAAVTHTSWAFTGSEEWKAAWTA